MGALVAAVPVVLDLEAVVGALDPPAALPVTLAIVGAVDEGLTGGLDLDAVEHGGGAGVVVGALDLGSPAPLR